MNRYFALLGLLVLVYGSGCCLPRCCTKTCCSSDGKTCSPEVKEIETTHNCYADKCKDVCIPAVRFPWEDCCDPLRCGKVRSVKVLTKWEYKCPDSEVKWNIINSGCGPYGCQGAGGCGYGNNCNGTCGNPNCGVMATPAPTVAPRPMPPVVTPEDPSPSDVPPMPPIAIEQATYFAPAI